MRNGGSRVIVQSDTIYVSMPTESPHFKIAIKAVTRSCQCLLRSWEVAQCKVGVVHAA